MFLGTQVGRQDVRNLSSTASMQVTPWSHLQPLKMKAWLMKRPHSARFGSNPIQTGLTRSYTAIKENVDAVLVSFLDYLPGEKFLDIC